MASPTFAAGSSEPHEVVVPTERDARQLREAKSLQEPQPGFGARLDRWHDRLFLGVQDFIERTDQRWADDDKPMLPVPAAPFRIGMESETIHNTGSGLDFNGKLDVDMVLQLPNIERRLRVFITSDDVEESPDRLNSQGSVLRAGLRLSALRVLDFDIGVRADFPDAAFVSLRWQREYRLGGFDLQTYAKAYLETGDGLGVASGITLDHWKNRWLLRSATYANWRKQEAATAWTQTLVLAHAREIIRFGRYGPIVRGRDISRGTGLQLLVSGEHTSRTDLYEASVFFKQATRKRWLYWYAAPLVRWEKDYDWKASPGLRIGIDALFWDLSDR